VCSRASLTNYTGISQKAQRTAGQTPRARKSNRTHLRDFFSSLAFIVDLTISEASP